MKLLFLLAFVGLAAAASLPKDVLPRRIVYQYDTQIATGMEEVSSDFSTVRMRFNVLMETDGSKDTETGARRWRIAFREVNVRQRNNATEKLPKTLLPMEQFNNLYEYPVWKKTEAMLKTPFVAVISEKDHSIVKVLFKEEDAFWSVNLKKGFLSFLNVNFLPERESSIAAEKRDQWTKEANEMTTAALCKTLYSANRVQMHDSEHQLFKVEKAIDFKSCVNPIDGSTSLPGVWNGLHHSEPLPQQMSKEPLNVNNLAKYLVSIHDVEKLPIVKKASSRTIYTLSPFSTSEHGTKRVIAIQKLRMLETQSRVHNRDDSETDMSQFRKISAEMSSMQEMPEGLRLIFPEEATGITKKPVMDAVLELAEEVIQNTDMKKVDIAKVEKMLRFLRYHLNTPEQLESVAHAMLRKGNSEVLLKMFILDTCPQVGSHSSVQFLMKVVRMLTKESETAAEFVRRPRLSIYDIPSIFTKLSMMSKIEMKSLKLIHEVIRSDSFRNKLMTVDRMPIFSSAWLSLGAMVNVYYSRQGGVEPYLFPNMDTKDIMRQYQQTPWDVRQKHAAASEEFRREFIQEIREGLQKKDITRTLALKVTKNCGLFELYQDVSRIILQKDNKKVDERVAAVYATAKMLRRHTLARIVSEDPRSIIQQEKFIRSQRELLQHFDKISRQIQADLVSCFRNVREDPEVRIACYRVLMQSPIKQTTLNMLVQTILSEPTQQVYAYCVQHMSQIAQNPLPRYQHVSHTVRAMLSMIKRREPTLLTYSRVFHGQMFDRLHEMGLSVETDMIVSDKSFTPRWTHFRIDRQAMGRNLPILEIAVRTQGLQNVLEKVMGPRGLLYKSGSFMKLLNRVARSLDSSIDIDSDVLDILPRILKEMPDMDMTISFMGYDSLFIKSSRNFIDAVRRMDGARIMNSLAHLGRFLQPMFRFFSLSSTYEVPTTVGSMLEMNFMLNMDFNPKVDIQKEFSDKKMKIIMRMQMPLNIFAFTRIGSNMHVLNHFQSIRTALLVNPQRAQFLLGLEIDTTEPQVPAVKILHSNPTSNTPLVVFKNTASSMITEHDFSDSLKWTTKTQLIRPRNVVEQMHIRYNPIINDLLRHLSFELEVSGKLFSNQDLFKAPCAMLMGQTELVLKAKAGENVATGVLMYRMRLYQTEEKEMLRIMLMVAQVETENTDILHKRIIQAVFRPTEIYSKMYNFNLKIRVKSVVDKHLSIDGSVQLPKDLEMTPKSLPLRSSEWIVDRQLHLKLELKEMMKKQNLGKVIITLANNPELARMLRKSVTNSQKNMLHQFPGLAQCLNESRHSINEETLKTNMLFTPSCVRQFKKLNQLNTMKVELIPESDYTTYQDSRICQVIKHQLQTFMLPYLTVMAPQTVEDSSKTVRINIQPSPIDSRVINVNLTSQLARMQWRSIQLPFTPFAWSSVDPLTTAVSDYVKGGAAKCKLMNSHVRTFDNVLYSIPKTLFNQIAENQCPVLLARDCSEKKEFQVLTHIKDAKKYITIQLRTDAKPLVIEVSKPIDSEEMQSTVKVNGRQLEIKKEFRGFEVEPEILRRTVNTKKSPITLVISKYQYAGTNMYRIRSLQQQVEVLVGGPRLRTVEIRVSPFFNNKICGLCGDYNSEKFREFKAPNYHRVMNTPQRMVEQYVLPISDECRFADDQEVPANYDAELAYNTYGLIQEPSFESIGYSSRRPTCQMSNSRRVRTYRHAEIDLMSPSVHKTLRGSQCMLKLAAVEVQGHKFNIFLQPSENQIIVSSSAITQRISINKPWPQVRPDRSDSVEGASVGFYPKNREDGSTEFVFCSTGESLSESSCTGPKLSIIVTQDRRVIINAPKILSNENAICNLNRLPMENSEEVFNFLNKYSNSDDSSSCKSHLMSSKLRCNVDKKTVQPFSRAGDRSPRSIKFLNSQLRELLAQSQAPLLLSADQVGDDESNIYSVQMVLKKEEDQTVTELHLKKNLRSLAVISVPEDVSAARVRYESDSAESKEFNPTSDREDRPMKNNFVLKVNGDRVLFVNTEKRYTVIVRIARQPEVTIERANEHPTYASAGLCQINRLPGTRFHHTNPRNTLVQVIEASLAAHDSEAPIFNESAVSKLNRLVRKLGSELDNAFEPSKDFSWTEM